MNSEEELLKKRFKELANKSYTRNIPVFTNFLGLLELSAFHESSRDFSHVPYELNGGTDFAERVVVQFGGFELPYPIACIHVKPVQKKFSDTLTHRDFLGALVNLGIKRELLGDIIIHDNEAFVFCIDSMADFIMEHLDRVKHTSVKCSLFDGTFDEIQIKTTNKELNVASLRLDAVVAEVCKLSRSQALALFREKKVFLSGRLIENNSYQLKPLDIVTVRGFGRFEFGDTVRETKKGRYFVTVKLYG